MTFLIMFSLMTFLNIFFYQISIIKKIYNSALLLASSNGNLDIVLFLLNQENIDVNAANISTNYFY